MATINADPATLDRVARNLDAIAGDISTQKRRIDTVREQTAAAWKSAYTSQYIMDVQRLGRNIQSTAESVRGVATQLRRAASRIRELERELARKQRESKK